MILPLPSLMFMEGQLSSGDL